MSVKPICQMMLCRNVKRHSLNILTHNVENITQFYPGKL